MEERKLREIEHSDRRRRIVRGFEYQTDVPPERAVAEYVSDTAEYARHFSNMKFYSITRSSVAYRDAQLFDGIRGATALDYCCGNGEVGIEMARRGAARVHGIDISHVAISNATELARTSQVDQNCEFSQMDSENTTFEADTFDVIHEYGALHHLELETAFRELARILKPGGKVVCTETLRHNPLIHMYRKLTPELRTEWEVEHILGVPEINEGRRYFNRVEIRFFHLTALAAVPLRKSIIFEPVLKLFETLDFCITRVPLLQRMAWIAVIIYSEPKKL
jgi:ubiquinone/menaquinone biosynthesis C-methylase UbiE